MMEDQFNWIELMKVRVVLSLSIAIIALLILSLVLNFSSQFSASYGGGWVAAFWSAYKGDVVRTLGANDLNYLTVARAVVGGLSNTWDVALFL